MAAALKGYAPVFTLMRAVWLDFRLATINPLAPDVGRLLVLRRELESPIR